MTPELMQLLAKPLSLGSRMLPALILVPILGGVVCALLPTRAARAWALTVSLLVAAMSTYIAFDKFNYQAGFLENYPAHQKLLFSVQREFAFVFTNEVDQQPYDMLGLPEIGFNFHLGLDTISLWLVLLTALLQPLAIAASFNSIRERQKEYYAWMLVLLGAMLGVFLARDLLLFYVFFELTLVPMFFLIGIWGGPERRAASGRFFLYTFAGGVFTLAGVVYLGLHAKSFDIERVIQFAQSPGGLTETARLLVLLAFLAGFAVKVPLFPVHTWLPLAHTEAPTAGSVILAGVLLKLGTYGLLRLAVPIGMIGPDGAPVFPALLKALAVLCIIGIIYGALVAWVQRDIKKLVAYSSVSHLGFCVLGLLALNEIGIQGSVLYMINHGLSTGALFLVIGMIYDRYHTRDIEQLSGLGRIMPKMAFFFVLFALSSIGLPGLNGFVSEFLTVLGAFTSDHLGIGFGAFAALGVILGAVYMLHMVARVIFGPLKVPAGHDGAHGHAHEAHGHGSAGGSEPIDYVSPGTRVARPAQTFGTLSQDINGREMAILIPIAVCCIALGIGSAFVTRSMSGPIELIRKPLPTAPAPTALAPEAVGAPNAG